MNTFKITLERAKRLIQEGHKYNYYQRRWNKIEADLLKRDLINFIKENNKDLE